MIKSISILGSTGSIGVQTLETAEALGIKIDSLAAGKNFRLLERQARKFKPDYVAMSDENSAKELKALLADTPIKVFSGLEGVCRVASHPLSERIIAAIVGIDGLIPVVNAIKAGKDICLANKETLVTAGDVIMPLACENNVKIIPVDSEHSAIFQCITQGNGDEVKKIILTASGGAFRGKKYEELEHVTVKDALAHPNWSMGAKITVDSATMMNKGFEVIEAKYLFDMSVDRIETVIHPQSIIHSAVEFVDGSIIAQLGLPDMRLPIQYALTWPDRQIGHYKTLSLFDLAGLTFERPDNETFGCLKLAYMAAKDEGNMKIVLNAANDVAVECFLKGEMKFLDIYRTVQAVMENFPNKKINTLQEIIDTVDECKSFTNTYILKNLKNNY